MQSILWAHSFIETKCNHIGLNTHLKNEAEQAYIQAEG